jgi:hypothetical protein
MLAVPCSRLHTPSKSRLLEYGSATVLALSWLGDSTAHNRDEPPAMAVLT